MRLRVTSLNVIFLFSLSLMAVLLATGLRPNEVGSDTLGYLRYYERLVQQVLDTYIYDYFFEVCSRILAFFSLPPSCFLIGLAFINIINIGLIARVLSRYLENKVNFYRIASLSFAFLFISPFFFSAQTNVLRQGISTFFLFLYFLFLLDRASFFSLVVTALLAQGFHHSFIFYFLFSPLVYLSYSTVTRFVLFLFVFYGSGLSQYCIHTFASEIYNKLVNYGVLSGYTTGIRYDFALFTLGSGFAFHLLSRYFLSGIALQKFRQILKIYWILTLPFFLVGFGAYSDRYLLPAWLYFSVLCAVFFGLCLRKYVISIHYYYGFFLLSSCYFIFRVQGVIG